MHNPGGLLRDAVMWVRGSSCSQMWEVRCVGASFLCPSLPVLWGQTMLCRAMKQRGVCFPSCTCKGLPIGTILHRVSRDVNGFYRPKPQMYPKEMQQAANLSEKTTPYFFHACQRPEIVFAGRKLKE